LTTGLTFLYIQIEEVAKLTHEELPVSLNTDEQGKEIPIELRMFLEKMKKEYLTMMEKMQVSLL
jgi:hypothetical protein